MMLEERLEAEARYDDYLEKTEGRGISYGEINYIESLNKPDLADFMSELGEAEEAI